MLNKLHDKLREQWSLAPGLIVLFVVLVLLYDFTGAVATVWGMVIQFAAAIVGGGEDDVMLSVMWQTLPLALAAGGVTFAITNGWLKLDSFPSLVVVGLIVMAGAVVGNSCHQRFGSKSLSLAQHETLAGATAELSRSAVNEKGRLAKMHTDQEWTPQPIDMPINTTIVSRQADEGLGRLTIGRHQVAAVPAPHQSSVWQRLTRLSWLARPDLDRRTEAVEPVILLPRASGMMGVVTSSINQLLGYLLAYEPRLFVASILAGSYAGWRLQRRVAMAQAMVSGDTSELTEHETKRLAA